MRRRVPEVSAPGDLPPEFAIGPCIEVWAEDAPPQLDEHPVLPINAHRRYARAFGAWADKAGIPQGRERFRLRPGSTPWSAAYLIKNGKSREVTKRLAGAGAAKDDIPRLKRAAQTWINGLKESA